MLLASFLLLTSLLFLASLLLLGQYQQPQHGTIVDLHSISAVPAVVYASDVPVVSAAVHPAVLMFLLTSFRDSPLLLASLQVRAPLLLLAFLLLL
jgi:hypothetical protein